MTPSSMIISLSRNYASDGEQRSMARAIARAFRLASGLPATQCQIDSCIRLKGCERAQAAYCVAAEAFNANSVFSPCIGSQSV